MATKHLAGDPPCRRIYRLSLRRRLSMSEDHDRLDALRRLARDRAATPARRPRPAVLIGAYYWCLARRRAAASEA